MLSLSLPRPFFLSMTGKVPWQNKNHIMLMIGHHVESVCSARGWWACSADTLRGVVGDRWEGVRANVLWLMRRGEGKEVDCSVCLCVSVCVLCINIYVCICLYMGVCIHRPLLLRCVRGGLESSTTPARPFPMTFGARRSSFWASVNASVSSFFHCTNSGSLCTQNKRSNQIKGPALCLHPVDAVGK